MDRYQQANLTSVTRELATRNSALRHLLQPHGNLLKRWRDHAIASLSGQPWIRPSNLRHSGLAGHAMDTRTRWWLAGVDSLPTAVTEGLLYCSANIQRELLEAYQDIAGTPSGNQDEELERRICRVAVAAASVEPLFRAGRVPCPLADLGFVRFQDEYADVVDDVQQLAAGLPGLVGDLAGSTVKPNPVVATGRLCGDADIVASGQLVEIKCTVDPRGTATGALQQMLVYAARLRPETMALLLPRQHTRVVFDLARHQPLLQALDEDICAAYGRPRASAEL